MRPRGPLAAGPRYARLVTGGHSSPAPQSTSNQHVRLGRGGPVCLYKSTPSVVAPSDALSSAANVVLLPQLEPRSRNVQARERGRVLNEAEEPRNHF